MNIKNILNLISKYKVTGISSDTRTLKKGDLFVCIDGATSLAKSFIPEAISKGAAAILSNTTKIASTIPIIQVDDVSKVLPLILSKFYDYPWREMQMIGITGTDGKTTTATYIEYFLNQKYKCSYIGTNGVRFDTISYSNKYTTLPICELTKTLRLIANHNIRYISMEVSSEGLINGRLDNVEFDVAIFTNLTHEHLNTHKTMENYLLAKLELFKKLDENGLAIINADDYYASYFLDNHFNYKKITFSIYNPSDFRITNIRYNNLKQRKYTYFDLITKDNIYYNLKTNITSEYNLYNLLPSIICALYYNISFKDLEKYLLTIPNVEGRLELLTTDEDFRCYVDFAHTPNGLTKLLAHLKNICSNNLICVIGSAGKKDKSKRSLMGHIATSFASKVIFTSEDPRGENPLNIIKDLLKDVKSDNYIVIENRSKAIEYAIYNALPNDIVVITGKGNDNYYDDGVEIYPYSDIQEVIKYLNERKMKIL